MGLEKLIGKTIVKIVGLKVESEQIDLLCSDGTYAVFYHDQDCCENVTLNDIVGDIEDLLNSPLVRAEERASNNHDDTDADTSQTWTFYELATNKGSVTIRWLGESNGFYSEGVTFVLNPDFGKKPSFYDYCMFPKGKQIP